MIPVLNHKMVTEFQNRPSRKDTNSFYNKGGNLCPTEYRDRPLPDSGTCRWCCPSFKLPT